MITKKILPLFLTSLLAACALEPRRPEPAPEPRVIVQTAPPSEGDQLLAYALKVRKLDMREFNAEREQVRSNLQKDRSDFNRVKYALLISLSTPAGTGDDAELIGALDPMFAAPVAQPESDVRLLAALLYGMAQERKKLREQIRDVQTRLSIAKRDETREAETRALRARVEELEKKLSALKSIDRSVNNRAGRPESTTK